MESTSRTEAAARFPWAGTLLVLAAAALVYGFAARAYLGGRLLDDGNLALDYDPSRYVEIYTGIGWKDESSGAAQSYGPPDRVKHPLILGMRGPTRALMSAGFSPEAASAAWAWLGGSIAAAAAWAYLRLAGVRAPEAALATGFFALSASQLFHSSIPESYGISAGALALAHLLALWRVRAGGRAGGCAGWFALPLALFTFGITSTNAAQNALDEAVVGWERARWRGALLSALKIGVLVALGALAILSLAGAFPWKVVLADPWLAIQQVWWTGSLQDPTPKAGVLSELVTFAGYAFVAPEWSAVSIDGGAKSMLDLREWSYAPLAAAASVAWMVAAALGTAVALRTERTRALALALVLCFLLQIALHAIFQFRQSLFLNATHAQFALFSMQAEALRRVAGARAVVRWTVLGGAALLVAVAAANNVERALELARAMQTP